MNLKIPGLKWAEPFFVYLGRHFCSLNFQRLMKIDQLSEG
jgi:hypothetical protein